MKSLNLNVVITVTLISIVLVTVSLFLIQHVNETAKSCNIVFRNSSNDGIIIFSVLSFFFILFLVTFLIEKLMYRNK